MNNLILLPILLLLAYLALVFQEMLPAFGAFGGARIQLVPMLFCLGAFLLGFPFMLILAFGCGILFDLMHLQFVGNTPEIALGATVFFFLLMGTICQGLKPLFDSGAWWLASLLSAISTSLLLFMQFVLLSFKRFESGGWIWSTEVAWRILLPGLVAMFLAPAFLLLLQAAGARLGIGNERNAYP